MTDLYHQEPSVGVVKFVCIRQRLVHFVEQGVRAFWADSNYSFNIIFFQCDVKLQFQKLLSFYNERV